MLGAKRRYYFRIWSLSQLAAELEFVAQSIKDQLAWEKNQDREILFFLLEPDYVAALAKRLVDLHKETRNRWMKLAGVSHGNRLGRLPTTRETP